MHHAQSPLRAIETGRYVVRSANTGVSSVINDRGEVLEKLDPLKTGYVLEEVRLSDRVTVYSRIGNVFAYACLALCGAAFLWSVGEGLCRRALCRRNKDQA
jgi:apolipoprotein N-acyltransferase